MRIAAPKNSKCIIYGAGYQGKNAYFMLDACGAEVVKFCDRDSARWHTRYLGKEVISPKELKENYSDVPVIIGLDSYIASKAAEVLYQDNIVKDVYFACDPVFSIPSNIVRDFTKVAKKRNVFLGKYQTLLPMISVLKFLGMDISYIVDIDGEFPLENTMGIEVRSPYDLCYENAKELRCFLELPHKQCGEEILKKFGLTETIPDIARAIKKRSDGYIILDPNLGHNIEFKGESSVITLSTKNNTYENVIACVGGSTSEICLCEEISWPEQFVSIAEKNNIDICMYAGGTAAYIVSQEVVKFLRDISFRKPDILISYSGCNDIYYARSHNFIPNYQLALFNALIKSSITNSYMIDSLQPKLNMPQGIDDFAEHWLHYERMMYAMCYELNIKFYAILQPILYTKKILSSEERNMWIAADVGVEFIKNRTMAMQKTVTEAKKIYPWLHDFSHIFDDHPETVYFDGCHLTSHGNKILAEKIFDLVKEDLR